MWFGVCLCFDQTLGCVTVQPLRVVRAAMEFRSAKRLPFDLACVTILIVSTWVLQSFVSASLVYHSLRLQTFMKLYVIVNIAEVLDRLLSSLGLDLFQQLSVTNAWKRPWLFVVRYFCTLTYCIIHAMLFYVRLLTLSVAVNSSNDALFTIIVSNNFVELKGSVFKRSTEALLFQISCTDIVERFVLVLFMFLVGLNFDSAGSLTLDLLSNAATGSSSSSGTGATGEKMLQTTTPVELQFGMLAAFILFVEVVVDWIKHSFIRRFNSDIRFDAYDRFLTILAEDFSLGSRKVFPPICGRLGLPVIPLVCVFIRVAFYDTEFFEFSHPYVALVSLWLSMCAIKWFLKRHLDAWSNSIIKSSEHTAPSTPVPPSITPPLPPVVDEGTASMEIPSSPSRRESLANENDYVGNTLSFATPSAIHKKLFTTLEAVTPSIQTGARKVLNNLSSVTRFQQE